MKRLWLIAILALGYWLAGCHSFERIPGQDRAEKITWEYMLMQRHAVPGVEWLHQERLNCYPDPDTGLFLGFEYPSLGCLGGLYKEGDIIQVALPTGYKISQSAYAHELLHAHFYFTYLNGDPTHSRPEWGEFLSQMNQALSDDGL